MSLNRWAGATLALLLACSSNDGPIAPGSNDSAPVVVALGDSLTAGPGLRESEAWPALIQERIRTGGLPHRMVNAGVSGDTTADGLARLDRALVPGTAVLIVALGANDGIRGVPVAEVERNLATIIERVQARNIRVLLCGIEALPNRGWEYTLEFHQVFPRLAARYSVPLMPFLLAGVVGRAELNLADGWHPNAAGMRVMADNIWPHLEPLLR